jgi:hypothetical protein
MKCVCRRAVCLVHLCVSTAAPVNTAAAAATCIAATTATAAAAEHTAVLPLFSLVQIDLR